MKDKQKQLLTEIMYEDAKDGLYKQQTAVEYLLEKLYTQYRFEFSGTIVDKAKAMEKEQVIEAWKLGNLPTLLGRVLTAEEYYNETYKTKIQ
jgi:hypothetical protein